MYRLVDKIFASRSAIHPSSRSARMYHEVELISSDSLRKLSSPRAGLGPSLNQPSIAGISCR